LSIVHQQKYFDAESIGAMCDKRWLEKDYLPIGIMHNTLYLNGNNFLHISENLKRTKQDTQFSIDINSTEGKNELYLYGYEY